VNNSGGSILLYDSNILIKNNTFANNRAPIGAAIRYLKYYPYLFLD